MFDLSGKVAVITGGNSGIGLGFARALAEAGASIAIWGRNRERNAEAVEGLRDTGAEVLAAACDVAVEEDVEGAMEATLDRFGHVDVCIANAGVAPRRERFVDYPTQLWRDTLAVNLDGPFFTLRAASRHMAERGAGGSLLVTGSLVAHYGFPRREAYAASKTGVLGLVRSLAVELARDGIRVNGILPGWIGTPLFDTIINRDDPKQARMQDAVVDRIPLRRFGAPEDLAGLVIYLASDASAYHTGDIITVDGGYRIF